MFIRVFKPTRKRTWATVLYITCTLLLSFVFVHTDSLTLAFEANQLALGHIHIYEWFDSQPSLKGLASPMLPLYYWSNGVYMWLLNLVHINPVSPTVWDTLYGRTHGLIFGLGGVVLKIPNISIILTGAWFMDKTCKKIGLNRKWATWLWLTSPLLISGFIMQGNMDGFAAVATIIAIYFFSIEKPYTGMIMLGVAAAYKDYALLIALPVAIILSQKKMLKSLGLFLVALLAYIVPIVPYLNQSFLHRVFEWREASFIFSQTIDVTPVPVYLYFLLYFFLLIYVYFRAIDEAKRLDYILWSGLTATFLVLLTGPWLPEWAIWTLPFAIFLIRDDRRKSYWFLLVSAIIVILNLFVYPHNLDARMLGTFFSDPSAILSYADIIPHNITVLLNTILAAGIISLLLFTNPDVPFTRTRESKSRRFVIASILPISIYVFAILSEPILGRTVFNNSDVSRQLINPGPILVNHSVEEVFQTGGHSFNTIKILFATFARTNTTHVQVLLRPEGQGPGKAVLVATLSADQLKDNSWVRIQFPTIHPTMNDYILDIKSSSSNPGNAVTVWMSPTTTRGTHLNVGGKQTQGTVMMVVTRSIL